MDTQETLERVARRRAGLKTGWTIHLLVYAIVNTGLGLLALMHGRSWALYPALGWGVGLLAHGLVVLLVTSGWPERLVESERRKLQAPTGEEHLLP